MRLAILGSGAGSTAEAVIDGARDGTLGYSVELVASNRSKAGILLVGKGLGVPVMVMPANGGGALIAELQSRQIDLLLLAGYLRLLPEEVIQAMGGMVVNTHPSLLPEFGGPGMYGRYVHEAVAAAGVAESGASLHWVSGDYDSGEVIEQVRVKLPSGSTAGEVEELVRAAEREWLPGAIGRLVATWKNASLNRPEPS